MGDFPHANLGIAHGGGGITVHRTEIALTIYQHVAQGEGLGHAHNGVIHSGIAVGVVFTDDITYHTGGFFIGLVPVIIQFVHGE